MSHHTARRLRRAVASIALALAAHAVPTFVDSVSAAPYASGVTQTGSSVSFVLNESGADIVIRRDGVATTYGTNLAKGVYTFDRQGASQYYIEVSKNAAAGYSVISTNSVNNNFELPRGVAINHNAGANGAPNPLFGRVYVANGRDSATASGRTMVDGIYAVNAALQNVFDARTAGIDFQTTASLPTADTTGVSPWKLAIGPDNRLYIADWSDLHSGLWSTDPDVTTNVEVLATDSRSGTGLSAIHGSVSDVVVTGTPNNVTVFTTDEDLNSNQRGVYSYALGSNQSTASAPTVVFADATNRLQNGEQSLAISPDGTFWVSQLRAAPSTNDTLPSVVQISADGSTILFDSAVELGGGKSASDPLRDARAIAFDPVNDILAVATSRSGGNGLIVLFDDDTKTVLGTLTAGGTTNTDIAFDAAGNLYAVNRSAERLLVWSPGGNTTWSTGSDGSFFQGVVPEPASLSLLALGSLAALRRRRRHA